MDLLEPKLLDRSFYAEIVRDSVQFELDAPDDEANGNERLKMVYELRVIDFEPVIVVTADGVELLREPLVGDVLVSVRGIWKEAQWHMDNRKRQEMAEDDRIRERVAAAIEDRSGFPY